MNEQNISWQPGEITKEDRMKLNGHKSAVLWLTGLSGSGKSTISIALEKELYKRGIHLVRLDGDNIRHGLNRDLGFSKVDRRENIRRIGEVSKLFLEAGILTITAFISPYHEDRQMIKKIIGKDDFIEVYIKCDIHECKRRDPKGLYKKVEEGEIQHFTGIDQPYEKPKNPAITLDTRSLTINESTDKIIHYLYNKRIIY